MSKHQVIKFWVSFQMKPLNSVRKTSWSQTMGLGAFHPSAGSLHPNRNGHLSSEAQRNSRPLQLGNATLLQQENLGDVLHQVNCRFEQPKNGALTYFNQAATDQPPLLAFMVRSWYVVVSLL